MKAPVFFLPIITTLMMAIAGSGHAQENPADSAADSPAEIPELDATIFSAGKFPQTPVEVGSAVTSLDVESLVDDHLIRSLDDALRITPGAILTRNGARGANSSIFLRGTNSNQTQFLVDGVRVTNSNILPNAFLGGERLNNLSTIEVLRGPQSALYGGEAIGGVISQYTRRGQGAPTFGAFLDAGSFGSIASGIYGQGEDGPLAYSFSIGEEFTENERDHNDFLQFDTSLRFDYAVSDSTNIGFTWRHASREYESPGSIFENDPDNIERDTTLLATLFLDSQVTDFYHTKVLFGWLSQDLEFETPPVATSAESMKYTLDWQNVFEISENNTLLAGVNLEHTSVDNSGFGTVNEDELLVALYLQETIQPFEGLTVSGGVRWEDYESFGDVWTWRGAASYEIEATGSRLHASVGKGFRAPSFFELYATDTSFIGNPDLQPEESIGWDVGIEQRICDCLVADVTFFHNQLDDLIVTDFGVMPSSVMNLDEARTQGIEASARLEITDHMSGIFSYTYLEADNETSGERLLRRPQHTIGADLNIQINDRILLGTGAYAISDRTDIDAMSFATVPGDDYLLWRFYGKVKVSENVHATLRVENAFDEDYDEVAGFPGRGFGAFGGISITF